MTNDLFLIARHGQTKLNKDGAHVGLSEAPLDDEGREEAAQAGEFLAHLPFNITYVVASPLARTQETAAIICDAIGVETFYTDERLRDLDVGVLSGKSELDNPLDEYIKNPLKSFPGGESVDDFNVRQYEFAKNLLDDIESGKLKPGSILVVTHAPVINFWNNVQSDKKVTVSDEIVRPGGVVLVTDKDLFPLFGKNPTPEEKQDEKMDPAVVLYMPPESLGDDGARCGTCVLGLSDSRCVSVHADDDKTNTDINLKTGVCGLYVNGELDSLVQIQPVISRTAAGYIDKGAPTSCGTCEYFTNDKEFGCSKVDGRKTEKGFIESKGCCNRWEEK